MTGRAGTYRRFPASNYQERMENMFRRLVLILLTLTLALTMFGQGKKKAPSERSVTGVVTDATGAPVVGAVVQLKNTRTLQVRSFITREKGDYYFNGLSTDIDYELKASAQGQGESPVRTLSSFSSQEQTQLNLQLK